MASRRYAGTLAFPYLTSEPTAGLLYDSDGHAFARLAVQQAAHYLIRSPATSPIAVPGMPQGFSATSLAGFQRHHSAEQRSAPFIAAPSRLPLTID